MHAEAIEKVMNERPKVTPFSYRPEDPLASELADVSAWIEEFAPKVRFFDSIDFKTLHNGRKLLNAKPEPSLRYYRAAIRLVHYWREQGQQMVAWLNQDPDLANSNYEPYCGPFWSRIRSAEMIVGVLLRRTLPFEKQDFLEILHLCIEGKLISRNFGPIGQIVRALQRYAATSTPDAELNREMKRFAAVLRQAYDKAEKRLGTDVEQILVNAAAGPDEVAVSAVETPPAPRPVPAPAGTCGVLESLKQFLHMLPDGPTGPTTLVNPDGFPLRDDSPVRESHQLLNALITQIAAGGDRYRPDLRTLPASRAVFAQEPAALGATLLAAAERQVHAQLTHSEFKNNQRPYYFATDAIVNVLLAIPFEVDRNGLFDLFLYLAVRPLREREAWDGAIQDLLQQAEREAATAPLTPGERFVLFLFRASLIAGPPLGHPTGEVARLTQLVRDGAGFFLVPGEAWSDALNGDLAQLGVKLQQHWLALLKHVLSATSARPNDKWLATCGKLVDVIGATSVREALSRWLPLVAQGRTLRLPGPMFGDVRETGDVIHEENATALRGFLWLVNSLPDHDELTRAIAGVALSAYKKVPGIGPRAVKVGNAAVFALSEMGSSDAVGQLAMLKVRIKFGTAQKEIEKAFNTSAEALGLERDQIEELGVPSYGLEEVGKRCEELGEYSAEILITGSDAAIHWFDASGKHLKSVPARVKSEHKDDLKELQQSLKDMQAMLPAQRDRIDALFLKHKSWPIEQWRERYLDHPLVGTVARRLLWCVDGIPALWLYGEPTDLAGQAVPYQMTSEITLWHPIGRKGNEISSWRRRLEELQVTQPFKQAHREVYPLTGAERNTRTYSNRFAAHILRQHQFNALCAARGWKNRLRLMVDDAYLPPTKELPAWGLRAEFWVEGVGDNYGDDTNEAGVYLRLATDQVRFYRVAAAANFAHASGGGYTNQAGGPGQGDVNAPLPLESVPALVFSEVMRDVDLFVGVASIGNDPTWQDGGPEGRYLEYYRSCMFGDLSSTAATRKEVLEHLVPRLKIADRCSFSDRYLIVRGDKRTYNIHLGSGNILMEPNDQYLCIVPDARARSSEANLFLPFEGDHMLSIIISKALLLANDSQINDPTIVQQIDRA